MLAQFDIRACAMRTVFLRVSYIYYLLLSYTDAPKSSSWLKKVLKELYKDQVSGNVRVCAGSIGV